ncbi:MAG TPA: pseudouridine synthase [Terracidiphilus sp.]|jgi:23S rRNA pseudouridine2605 synthase|nr:pseudouridine synthase [Terracidiphilus sp.]
MPRKKKTSAETEPAAETPAQKLTPAANAATEPGDDLPRARRKMPLKTAEKPAAKKRTKTPAKKAAKAGLVIEPALEAAAAAAAASEAPQPAEAEAAAHAADTFEDAFEANDSRETRSSTTEAAAAPEPDEKHEESPGQEQPDEADELEGDWESGSGDDREEKERERPPARQERLQKILAAAGVASRRHAEELIVEGRVQVNGQVVTTLGTKADPARDHIRVDGKLLHGAERLRYFVLNKPRGYVTTVSDPEGRPTVMEFFARMSERLYPVGRLDYLSEGLLLMTNDGELANKLTRAASGVEKVYLVKVAGKPDENKIAALREGVRIDRGRAGEGSVRTAPARIRQIRQGENPWFEVGLIEGRNRELRKMFEEIGHHVEKIRRVGYGPLVLDQEPGKMRELEPEEVQALRLAADGKLKPKRVKTSEMLPREAGRTKDLEAGKRRGEKPPFVRREDRREGGAKGRAAEGRFEGRPERRAEGGPPRRAVGRPAFRPQGGFAARPAPGPRDERREFRPREERGGFPPRGDRPQVRGGQAGAGGERGAAPPRGAARGAERQGSYRRSEGTGQRERAPERGARFEGQRSSASRPFRDRPATGPGTGSGTGSRPAFKPAGKPGFKPGFKPDFKPGFKAGFKPGFKPGVRPPRPAETSGEGGTSTRRFERPAERPPRQDRGGTEWRRTDRGAPARSGPAAGGTDKRGPARFDSRPRREGKPSSGRGGRPGSGPRTSGPGRGGPGRGGPSRGGKPGSFGKRRPQ